MKAATPPRFNGRPPPTCFQRLLPLSLVAGIHPQIPGLLMFLVPLPKGYYLDDRCLGDVTALPRRTR